MVIADILNNILLKTMSMNVQFLTVIYVEEAKIKHECFVSYSDVVLCTNNEQETLVPLT